MANAARAVIAEPLSSGRPPAKLQLTITIHSTSNKGEHNNIMNTMQMYGSSARNAAGKRRKSKPSVRKATAIGTACAAALSVVMAAPAGALTIAKASTSVENVVWWNMWSGSNLTITDKMVTEFNASHPNIHVTQLNVPSNDGDAKLLSAIAGGDPPDVFTEWNPTMGSLAATGAIQPLTPYEAGTYAGIEKWMYPQVAAGGVYNGALYAIPMSMNTWALYYNKSMLKAAGVSTPPKTLAQLDADQAKEWKMDGSRAVQIGFYPIGQSWVIYSSYFNVHDYTNGKYNLASDPGAKAEMKWMASYSKYSYSAVNALDSAYGTVAGGNADPFIMGREGFEVNGVWEAATNIPAANPPMANNFGVVPFPSVPGGATGPSTWLNGNYNVIPKGAKDPKGALTFMAWLAGFHNPSITQFYPLGGWMPPSPTLISAAPFQKWEKQVPYVKLFANLLTGKDTVVSTLTPTESEYFDASTTALEALGTHKMTATQALQYIDAQANK